LSCNRCSVLLQAILSWHEVADGRLEIAAISNPAPIRELTIASPVDHPGSTAITLVTSLLRDEVGACRAEGLWDIDLT